MGNKAEKAQKINSIWLVACLGPQLWPAGVPYSTRILIPVRTRTRTRAPTPSETEDRRRTGSLAFQRRIPVAVQNS